MSFLGRVLSVIFELSFHEGVEDEGEFILARRLVPLKPYKSYKP